MISVISPKVILYLLIYLPITLPIALIILYLVTAIPLYIIASRANYNRPWFAYIPICNEVLSAHLGNLSGFMGLGLVGAIFVSFAFNNMIIASILGIIVAVLKALIYFQFLRNFNIGLIGLIIAVFISPVFLYWYIVLTNKTFIGYRDGNFNNY